MSAVWPIVPFICEHNSLTCLDHLQRSSSAIFIVFVIFLMFSIWRVSRNCRWIADTVWWISVYWQCGCFCGWQWILSVTFDRREFCWWKWWWKFRHNIFQIASIWCRQIFTENGCWLKLGPFDIIDHVHGQTLVNSSSFAVRGCTFCCCFA